MFVLGSRANAVKATSALAAQSIATSAREVLGKPCKIVNLGGVYKLKCGDLFVCRDM